MPTMHPHLRRLLSAAKDVHPSPTDKQREALNYPLGHLHIHGLNISIETAKGQVRTKVRSDGTRWSRTMKAHYGYIRGTTGADGDHCDVYIGDYPQSELVFIVKQMTPDGKKFDEYKILLGYHSAAEAREFYLKHYPKDWKGLGELRGMFMPDFKKWLDKHGREKRAEVSTSALANLIGIPAAAAGAGIGAYTSKPGDRVLNAARLGASGYLTGMLSTYGSHAGSELASQLNQTDGVADAMTGGGAVAGGLGGAGLGWMLYGQHWDKPQRRRFSEHDLDYIADMLRQRKGKKP